jgi:Rps23 Pro-64 3,4-dihydroxylase Tpa1-like proline 4-hydroxylase
MRNFDSLKPLTPLMSPFVVIDDFLPTELAQAMRADIEAHFSNPFSHHPDTHQIWNYWFVPGQYAYLRTLPEKVIQRDRVEQFLSTITNWSTEVLGLQKVKWPYLSLYVTGCRQGLHNDAINGRFAFVYSLTRGDRRGIGGATMLLREGDLFRVNFQAPKAGTGFYELIEPRFNRLTVFDDRLIHGVESVEGSMDPADGRCVLHGHIEESGPIVTGALPIGLLREGIGAVIDRFVADWSGSLQLYHGPLVVRFTISPDGRVSAGRMLLDRVMHEHANSGDWEPVKLWLMELLGEGIFPAAQGETTVTLPITFGQGINASHA